MVLFSIVTRKLNFTVFSLVIYAIRFYWDCRMRYDRKAAIAQVLTEFEAFLYKSRPKMRNRLGIRRERAGTLMPNTIQGHVRVLKKVLRDLNTVCPTFAESDAWLIDLQRRESSWNHCSNSATAIEWMYRFHGLDYRGARPQKKTGAAKHVLTEEEINGLYAGCRTLRDTALLSAFFSPAPAATKWAM